MYSEERAGAGKKVLLVLMLIFVAAVIGVLVLFIMRRVEEVKQVCEPHYVDGVEMGEICGGEE